MILLQKFILENPNDWEEKLKHYPYNLIIKNDNEHFVLFKYNQYDSDLSNPIVQECRGIILDKTDNFSIACYPFNKFFNFEEENAAKIDWNSARVQTKVDGSITKLWWNKYDNRWMVSTNSCIDAFTVDCSSPKVESFNNHYTFGKLFMLCAEKQRLNFTTLNKIFTYIFELTSIYNEQVIHYDEPMIWHIGTRNNYTCKELDCDLGIQKPKEWKFQTFDDVVKTARAFHDEQEGFVLVDKDYNRVKVKSPYYVMTSHAINDNIGINNLIDIFLSGDYEEFLSYFPKYSDVLERMDKFLQKEIIELTSKLHDVDALILQSADRLTIFNQMKNNCYQKYIMRYYTAKVTNVEYEDGIKEWLMTNATFRDRLKQSISGGE